MSAIPYVACALVTAVTGVLSDRILHHRKNPLSKVNIRRLHNAIGLLFPMAAIICLSFVKCNVPYLGVFFLTLGLAFK
jgi:hypothetical protein